MRDKDHLHIELCDLCQPMPNSICPECVALCILLLYMTTVRATWAHKKVSSIMFEKISKLKHRKRKAGLRMRLWKSSNSVSVYYSGKVTATSGLESKLL